MPTGPNFQIGRKICTRGESVLTVAYFAALLARSADRWQARDADLDEIEDLAGLTELMREVSEDEDEEPDTAVLLLEQEDVWFAVVRVDADDEPRVFVSDAAAISRSAYAELLLAAGLPAIGVADRVPEAGEDLEAAQLEVDGEVADVAEAEESDPAAVALVTFTPFTSGQAVVPLPRSGPAGDIDLLVDLGVPATALTSLCAGRRPTAEALADLAAALGAAEELEGVR
jgi:putative tRNA adenosine deaminase-associated protein